MKKLFLSLVLGGVLLAGCKKDDAPTDCAETVAGIAGNYKITKFTVAGSDATSTFYDACDLSGVYALKADGTATYAESGTSCSTTTGTGAWSVTGTTINLAYTSGNGDDFSGTVSNNCSNITISDNSSGVAIVLTLTKQ